MDDELCDVRDCTWFGLERCPIHGPEVEIPARVRARLDQVFARIRDER